MSDALPVAEMTTLKNGERALKDLREQNEQAQAALSARTTANIGGEKTVRISTYGQVALETAQANRFYLSYEEARQLAHWIKNYSGD